MISYYWDRADDSIHRCAFDDARVLQQWRDFASRRVAFDFVNGYCVSTVFLATDHNWFGSGEPLLFETMVFAGDELGDGWVDPFCDRYSTAAAARLGHAAVVEALRAGKTPAEIGGAP